jgi:hypothetical protein
VRVHVRSWRRSSGPGAVEGVAPVLLEAFQTLDVVFLTFDKALAFGPWDPALWSVIPVQAVVALIGGVGPGAVELFLEDPLPITSITYAWAGSPMGRLVGVNGLFVAPFSSPVPFPT